MDSARNTFTNFGWISVAALDSFILLDLLFNSAEISIKLFYLFGTIF